MMMRRRYVHQQHQTEKKKRVKSERFKRRKIFLTEP